MNSDLTPASLSTRFARLGKALLPAVRWTLAPAILAALLVPSLSGCAFISQLGGALPNIEKASYTNLAGQTVAIMVWAEDNGVRMDWPNVHLDLAQMIQQKMLANQASDKPAELKGTRFPVSPASVVRFQEEHPDLAAESVADIAPRLGVTRVIYIEIRSFGTRAEAAADLFRGNVTALVNVVEVNQGKGRVAYTDDTLHVSFPRTAPEEGLPNLGDFPVYHGTLDGLANEIAKRFAPHANDPDAEYEAYLPK